MSCTIRSATGLDLLFIEKDNPNYVNLNKHYTKSGLYEVSTDRRKIGGEHFLYSLYTTSDIPIMLKTKENTILARNFRFVYDHPICINQNLLNHIKIL